MLITDIYCRELLELIRRLCRMLAGSLVPCCANCSRHTRLPNTFSDIFGNSLLQILLLISVEWCLRSLHLFPGMFFLPLYNCLAELALVLSALSDSSALLSSLLVPWLASGLPRLPVFTLAKNSKHCAITVLLVSSHVDSESRDLVSLHVVFPHEALNWYSHSCWNNIC